MSSFIEGIIIGFVTGIPSGIIGNFLYAKYKKKPHEPYVKILMDQEKTTFEGMVPNSDYSRTTVKALQLSIQQQDKPTTD